MTGRHRLGEPIAQHRAPHQPTSGLRKAAVAGAFAVVLLGIGVATEPTTMHTPPAPLLATPPAAPATTTDPDTPMVEPPLLTPAPTVIHHHTRPRPLPVPASVTEQVVAPTADPAVEPATEQPAAPVSTPEPVQQPAPVPVVQTVQRPTYTAWSTPYYSSYPTYSTQTRHHRRTHRSDR